MTPAIADVLEGRALWALESGEALAFLASLPDACVDAVITDPPYSSGGAFRGDRTAATGGKYNLADVRADFAGDNRDQRSFAYWCTLWLSECLRVAKPGAPICVFTDWRQLPTTTDALQSGGWVWRGVVPWNKTEAARPQLGRFRQQCEYVVWGSAGPMPQERSIGALPGFFTVCIMEADKHHQTGKPPEVMSEIARIVAPGGVVLDPFAGSATTGVGALMEARRFIGCEQSPAYVEIGRARLAGTREQVRLFEGRAPRPKQALLGGVS